MVNPIPNSKTQMVFWGTDNFAVAVLENLKLNTLKPDLIVTVPDRPAGRKQIITPPPAKTWAEANQIEVFQPESLKRHDLAAALKYLKPYRNGIFLVASYGLIIPPEIINLPTHGSLNIHPSLLPHWRGPSPIQSAILNDDQTGVSLMLMDEKMDHGPIMDQKKVDLEPWPIGYFTAEAKLAEAGAQMLVDTLPDWLAGRIKTQPQDHSQATFSSMIKKTDAELDLEAPGVINFRKIQAYKKWPRAYFWAEIKGQKIRVIVTEAELDQDKLIFKKVIPAGQKETSWEQFRSQTN